MGTTISVIIPTLNERKFIETVLKSLRNQNYEGKYEIIVADGMSRDDTVKIAKKYADRIVLVKKKGIGAGRNAGARVAKGDIFLFVDADTMLLFNGLKEMAEAFREKGVVAATCPVIPQSFKARDFSIYWIYNQFVKASMKTKIPQIGGMCCAYRKDAFWKAGGFSETLQTYEDYDLSRKVVESGKCVFVENTMAITSSRRIEAWGGTKAAKKYLTSYLIYLLTEKGMTRSEYRPVR